MIKHLLRSIFRKSKSKADTPLRKGAVEVIPHGDTALAKVDMDTLNSEGKQELYAAARELSDLTFYEGHVEHGYTLRFVSNAQQCPRCRAATKQHYANFIYATQIAPRVMLAPAGYFCASCPTVILDEEMIRAAVSQKFTFQGVLGLDYDKKKPPDLFKTWNGKDAIYMLDEHQTPMGLSTIDAQSPLSGLRAVESSPAGRSTKKARETKQRKRMARASRKKNLRRR